MLRFTVICLAAVVLSGCGSNSHHRGAETPGQRGGVTLIRPRCAGVRSCLLGQVVAAENANPMARAAVFLELEAHDGRPDAARTEPLRILTLTDDQGVFTVTDAPPGHYRLAVYKDARRVEVRGIALGQPGTTVVPVRLPPS